jgi:superfamily II DNA or RNA helicase
MSVLWATDLELSQLRPLAEALLMAMAAIGQPAARGHLAHTLARSGVAPEAARWVQDPAGMAPALDQLAAAGLAREVRNGFWGIVPAALEPVCRRAHRQGRLKTLAAAGQASYDAGKVILDSLGRDLAAFRLAFLEGRGADWQAAQARLRQVHGAALEYREPLALICAQPFDPAWFEALSPAQQAHGAWALLHDQAVHGRPEPAFRDWLEARAGTRPNPLGPVAEYLVLAARGDEAAALLARLSPAQRALPPMAMLQAALDLVQGRPDRSAAGFRAVLADLAAGARRRAVHLPGLMDLFCLLAFLGEGRSRPDHCPPGTGPSAAAERLDLLERRPPGDPLAGLAAPLRRLLHHRLGQPRPVEPGPPPATALAGFVAALCGYLCGDRPDPEVLDALRARLAPLPLGLFQSELTELRRRARGALGGPVRPLLDLVPHQETWERALEELHGLARHRGGRRPARLAWWVWRAPDTPSGYGIEAREQRQDAQGRWSRGRAVGLKRLREEARSWPFLLPQDQDVIACIREHWRGAELDPDAALQALVGHPLVFWSEDGPDEAVRAELVAGQPELRVTRCGDQLELRLDPPLEEGGLLVRAESLSRIRIIPVTPAHRQLAAILGPGLRVPAGAEDQVLQALGAAAPMVTVRSDVPLAAEAARRAGLERVAGDPRVLLLLMPFHQGLKVQLRVEPLAGAGYHLPGQGGAELLAEHGGRMRLVVRDLAAEAGAADALLAALPALPLEEGRREWVLDDPERCLDLLLDLEAAGDLATVQWPEGGRLAPPRVLGLDAMRMTVKRSGSWFEAEGGVPLDPERVASLQELLAAAEQAGGSRFVRLGDGKVYALAESFRRRLDDLRSLGETRGEGLRLHRLSALALEGLEGELGGFQADPAWQGMVQRLRGTGLPEPEVPPGFRATLRPYQMDGYRWLLRLADAGLGACLADDMGLGKTVQALGLLLARAGSGPALVVAPTSVCANWEAEAATFAPALRVRRFGEGDREEALAAAGAGDLLICTYGLLPIEAERLARVAWGTVVLDEGQNIKNALTKRSQAVMGLRAGFRLVLSGTPVENHLAELWNLFRFLDPGLLGTLERFRRRFQEPIERDQDAQALARLRRLVAPFLLRRTKAQVLGELPPRTDIVLELEPSPAEAAFLEALRRQSLESLSGRPGETLQVLAALMRLRRACCNPALVRPEAGIPSTKLEAFLDLVDELRESGHRALVFSQFTDHLALLREALDARGVVYQYLDGSTPARRRAAAVKAFQAGEGELFLISLRAGGTGLNLTAADYIIHMDPWWNPAVEDQASDRAHRIGQTRPVTVYRLVLKGSVEQKILQLHAHKRQLADDLLSESAAAAGLDAEALLALLQEA